MKKSIRSWLLVLTLIGAAAIGSGCVTCGYGYGYGGYRYAPAYHYWSPGYYPPYPCW